MMHIYACIIRENDDDKCYIVTTSEANKLDNVEYLLDLVDYALSRVC